MGHIEDGIVVKGIICVNHHHTFMDSSNDRYVSIESYRDFAIKCPFSGRGCTDTSYITHTSTIANIKTITITNVNTTDITNIITITNTIITTNIIIIPIPNIIITTITKI